MIILVGARAVSMCVFLPGLGLLLAGCSVEPCEVREGGNNKCRCSLSPPWSCSHIFREFSKATTVPSTSCRSISVPSIRLSTGGRERSFIWMNITFLFPGSIILYRFIIKKGCLNPGRVNLYLPPFCLILWTFCDV